MATRRSASTTTPRRSPAGVSRYSTVGGRDAITRLSRIPASSSSTSRAASVRGGIRPTAWRNSLYLTAPSWAAQRIESNQRRSRRLAAWRTSSGTGAHFRQRGTCRSLGRERTLSRLGLERQLEHLTERHDRMEAHLLTHVLRHVVQVGPVPLRQDHVGE